MYKKYCKRGWCEAEQKFIEGHKRRTCLACKREYQKKWRTTEKGIIVTKRHNNKYKEE